MKLDEIGQLTLQLRFIEAFAWQKGMAGYAKLLQLVGELCSVLFDDAKCIVVNRDHVLGADPFGGEQSVFRSHGEEISDRDKSEIDLMLASDELYIAE